MASPSSLEHQDGPVEARRRVIDDFGQLYAHFGLALTFGRAFALLLLSDRPLSLDEIAANLEVSKSAVSVATRDLERVGIARRVGTPGSRRVLYEASEDMLPIFQAQFARIQRSLPVLERAAALLPPGLATDRLQVMTELHEFWLAESEGIVERWRRRRNGR
jgi:DNA-binding transcriptional regulator GbsR (MarR family)